MTRPTRLNATFYEKIWGSTHLEPWFPSSRKQIGEVWFTAEPPLPILVKFLFTSGKLSVQVHPAGPGPLGKTEMWYILRADAGARIALGFREPVSRERLRDAARSGEIENLLEWFAVKAGETYFAPARTVHAIGAGIALCEIQQNSDVTYRLYDYGRPRELHLEQAAAISDLDRHPGASVPIETSPSRALLARCDYFETELLTAPPKDEVGNPHLLVFLEGRGAIDGMPFRAGEVWLAPEGGAPIELSADGPFRALRVREPH